MKRLLALAAVIAASAGLWAIASAGAERPVAGGWRWTLPGDFPQPRVPRSNPMSRAKVAVGRRLFYDVRLSGNGTQSCASCHRPELAFSDGKALAVGSTGEVHPRNAQSLVNVVYQQTLTWANPALVTLEAQMAVPLFGSDPVEMGVTDGNRARVLKRIAGDRWYRRSFSRAFPGVRNKIGWTTIVQAIAAFERSIVAADAKYDRAARGSARLTAPERRGASLFMGERAECHHCHGTFIFNDQATFVGSALERPLFHNTGLYNVGGTGAFPEPNRGLFEITGRAEDMGKFKAPSLRNVALTAPYMHDGSIGTLAEAVDHYAAGGRLIPDGPLAGDGRSNPYKDPLIAAIRLTPRDRADLVAFLRTLTDTTIATDPAFADPFRGRRP
ncbi:di-heme enzyme [Conexibacter sp. JD483]|uniref:methanobactin export MATE transporter MbnM n=1 Tax=unclassified Conexibacter TaxID=2627773 RepID=UPI0027220DB9|nr:MULTISPECIES: methanobactin export MATE transporter MbnM [unclassified Conexibacter]MDO8188133.1 di-heme enzyme [Conexibacter sp. CPCC 205706]MDO8201303.1 di-heme enzyme [Conexibacter sp. CPCC 205762]MDR9370426.1 di-heme enzyme [Conexibacter sp. JD483]